MVMMRSIVVGQLAGALVEVNAFLQMSKRGAPYLMDMAYMTFQRPSTFVFRIRSTYWKSSPSSSPSWAPPPTTALLYGATDAATGRRGRENFRSY